MSISVGPTVFAVIRYSLNHSYKAGIAFVLGVSVSDIMYVALANLAAPFLDMLKDYETEIAYGGAGILMAMGIMGLVKKYKPKSPSTPLITMSSSHYFRIWGSGFLLNTINPAVFLLWLASATYLGSKHTDALHRIIFYFCCLGLVLSVDFLKVFLADKIRNKLTLKLTMRLQRISALIMLGFGLAILIITVFHLGIGGESGPSFLHAGAKDTTIHSSH